MTPPDTGGLREQLLEQATRLFALKGFAGTSMRELVESCECTKAACYYYFSSKEALYKEVVQHHLEHMNALIRETVACEGSTREHLHAGLETMIDYAIANPLTMLLMKRVDLATEESEYPHQDMRTHDTHLWMITEAVMEGTQSGELRQDIDPEVAALVLTGVIHFQFDISIASGEWNRDRMHNSIDLVLDGIATHDTTNTK